MQRIAEVLGLGPVELLSPERVGMLRTWSALSEEAVPQWLEYGSFNREQASELIVETGTRVASGLLDEMADVIGEGAVRAAT